MDFTNSLYNLLCTPNSMAVFLAPPAWGKTSMLLELQKKWEGLIVYISPLKALASEFANRFKGELNVEYPQSKSDFEQCVPRFVKRKVGLLVATAELFCEEFFELLKNIPNQVCIILDELHLFFHWGRSFRPWLEEVYYLALSCEKNVLGLSATLEDEYLSNLKENSMQQLSTLFLIDFGNGELKTKPNKIINYRYIGKKKLIRRLVFDLQNKRERDVLLVFCRYRKEVQFWVNWCLVRKINALGCVGGEVDLFQLELKNAHKLDVIFSTTTLSHGVNLPSLSRVYLLYEITRKDFWVQMVGRAGRKGEKYDLIHYESEGSFKLNLISACQCLVDDVFYRLIKRFRILWKQKLRV